ncbi:MAG: peptide chain release factor N(5)-glutamine methyltransferase [bacterium]
MNAQEELKQAADALRKKGIPFPEKEAAELIMHVLGVDRITLIRENPVIGREQSAAIDGCIERRLSGEPLQYIMGFVEFYGLKIRVGRGVLIPRPETELLVEEVLKAGRLNPVRKPLILDMCTGSGCIALALAKHIPVARVFATDTSEKALEYAQRNALMNTIENVTFLRGNIYEPVQGMRFDLIVSNPPYIRNRDIPHLQEEIRSWEPLEALAGGEDGLDYYRTIIGSLNAYLREAGCCFLEIGYDQKEEIEALAGHHRLRAMFKKDMAGHDRIAILSK